MNSEHGSHLRIIPSIIILHAKLTTVGPQVGLFRAAHSKIGRSAVRYYGFVVAVRTFHPFYYHYDYQFILRFRSGCGKNDPLVGGFSSGIYDREFMLSISSAIIEDIKKMREARSCLIAYYYFDFKDASKRDLRGLLASLLLQLSDDSDSCWEILHDLYTACHAGSEKPSNSTLSESLKNMLKVPGQAPIFLILDALDECPSTRGTPSAREKVLDFMEDLVGSYHPNLFICITSRPEQDIQFVLNPLTSPSLCISLHEEVGQQEDIIVYIRSFVYRDRSMRRWRGEERELVINMLSERACGM